MNLVQNDDDGIIKKEEGFKDINNEDIKLVNEKISIELEEKKYRSNRTLRKNSGNNENPKIQKT